MEKTNFILAFLVGFFISISLNVGSFLFTQWNSLVPSWDLITGDEIVIRIMLSILGGLFGVLVFILAADE